MAIKTITTIDGVNEVDFGPESDDIFWFINIGATTVYISGNPDIIAGGDDVAELTAGSTKYIEKADGKVYVLGAGKVEIHNTRDKFPPFRNAPAAGGGEAVDAYSKTESDAKYAQKTDVIPYKMGMDIGTCATSEATITKTVSTLNEVAPTVGAVFAIKFVNAVPAQARLTVNGLSGYIQYRGSSIPAGIINAGDVVTFMYYQNTGFNRFEILSIENGGNAATVGGVGIANLRQITQTVLNTLPTVPTGEGDFLVNCDTSDTSFPYWYGYLSIRYGSYTGEYVATFRTTGNDNKVYYNTYLTNHWSGWQEISATPIKSTTFSGTTDAYSNIALWTKSENKIPILFECEDKNAAVFYGKSGNFYAYVTDNLHQNVVETAVSGTVWYVEV